VLADPEVRTIAHRLGTGTPQVIFAFALQVGMLPLTGTTNPQHMAEDLQAQDLVLSDDEVRRIETIAP
jgi:diketogulonate reductase-like aldo/keto reductase